MLSERVEGIEALFDEADYFIIDLWGVLHHGQKIFPYAIDVIHAMKKAGKAYGFLSNAPRRAHIVKEQLKGRGLPEELLSVVHTSGEEALVFLQHNPYGWQSVIPFNPQGIGGEIMQDIPLEWCDNLNEAHAIFNAGVPFGDDNISRYEEFLQKASLASLPMICANPDLWVQVGEELFPCAGLINQTYEKMGGISHYFGKPYADVYKKMIEMMNIKDTGRVMAIGDLIETDIKGGNEAGFKTCLIEGGVLSKQIGYKAGDSAPDEVLGARFEAVNQHPDFIVPLFSIRAQI